MVMGMEWEQTVTCDAILGFSLDFGHTIESWLYVGNDILNDEHGIIIITSILLAKTAILYFPQ